MQSKTLKKITEIIGVYYKVVIYSLLIAVSIALAFFVGLPKVYEVRTLIQIEPKNNSQIAGFDEVIGLEMGSSDLDQEERIYLSRSVIGQVVEDLELNENIESLQSRIIRINIEDNRWTAQRTGLLEFVIFDTDIDYSKRVLGRMNEVYIGQNIERFSSEVRNSINFLDDSIKTVSEALQTSENELNQLKESTSSIDISFELESKLNAVIALDEAIRELNVREESVSLSYKPNHPIYSTLINQRNLLIQERESINKEISELPKTERDFIGLSRNVEINRKTLETMLNRKLELSVIEASTTGNVRIIDEPYAKITPVSPKFIPLFAFMIFLGGLVSGFWIFFKENFDKKILKVSDLDDYLDLNKRVYGVVPVKEDDSESFKESVKTLVANILLSKEKIKTIMITGPTSGVGKTAISSWISESFAELNKKTIVLDLDLRRGDIHEIYDLKSIKENDYFDEKSITRVSSNLDVLPRIKGEVAPSKIILSPKFDEMIEKLRNEYDFIIIDTPPVLSVSDPLILNDKVDLSFIVIRHDFTKARDFAFAVDTFTKSEQDYDGVIMNAYNYELNYGYDYYNYKYQGLYKYEKNQ